ncbi:MAG: hypothetical protein ACREBR_00435 [bacterium]
MLNGGKCKERVSRSRNKAQDHGFSQYGHSDGNPAAVASPISDADPPVVVIPAKDTVSTLSNVYLKRTVTDQCESALCDECGKMPTQHYCTFVVPEGGRIDIAYDDTENGRICGRSFCACTNCWNVKHNIVHDVRSIETSALGEPFNSHLIFPISLRTVECAPQIVHR